LIQPGAKVDAREGMRATSAAKVAWQ
jgi:hypothetical protein